MHWVPRVLQLRKIRCKYRVRDAASLWQMGISHNPLYHDFLTSPQGTVIDSLSGEDTSQKGEVIIL